MKLPKTISFDADAYPELSAIFADIDIDIAAMVATDPGFQTRSVSARRGRKPSQHAKVAGKNAHPSRRAAA